jgi:hypothetical protein
VKKVLANTCGLHRTYCVTHDDTDVVKRLMEDHGVRNVFTTQVRVVLRQLSALFKQQPQKAFDRKDRPLLLTGTAQHQGERSRLDCAGVTGAWGQLLVLSCELSILSS